MGLQVLDKDTSLERGLAWNEANPMAQNSPKDYIIWFFGPKALKDSPQSLRLKEVLKKKDPGSMFRASGSWTQPWGSA